MEFANWLTFEVSLMLALVCLESKTISPRVVCVSHFCLSQSYILSQDHTKNVTRHNNVFCGEGRQIRPAELGMQPVLEHVFELWMNYEADRGPKLDVAAETPQKLSENKNRKWFTTTTSKETSSRSATLLAQIAQIW